MNSNKIIFALLLIFAVLSGAFFLQQRFTSGNDRELQTYLEQFQGYTKESITEIKLTRGDQSLTAKNEAEQWRSEQSLLDTAIITSLVDQITSPEEIILISQNSDQHANYEVTAEKATVVSLVSPTGEKKVLIGAPASGNYYIRIDGSNEVWGVQSMTDKISNLSLSQWLEKSLLTVDEERINTFVLEKSGNSFTLQQRDKNWFIDGGEQALDKTTLSDLLMQLESLVALGVLDDARLSDFPQKPALKLTINAQGTTPVSIEFFTGKDSILAKMSDRPGNFEISQSTFDDLNLNRNEIKFAPSPTQAQ